MNPTQVISTAWSGMLAVLIAMLIVDVLRCAMRGEYKSLTETLAHDPGPLGLKVLVAMLCLNALVQVAVQLWSAPPLRTGVLVLSVLYTLFFVLHQAVHMAQGEKPGLHTVLDLTHHALGAAACWGAWVWVQQG